ncbi:MAG: hypothetical protein ABFS43_14440 [Thermodesulfobacteriota bacterium]
MRKAALILMVLGCFVMFQACASAPKLPEAKPGLYVNPEFSFTVEYPENYVAQPLQGDEVFRTANPNPYLIPVLTISVADADAGAKLESAPFLASAQAAVPGSKRFKVLSEEKVTLNDGTPGLALTYKWTFMDGMTKLQTASMWALKDGKSITASCTTILGGDTTPEMLLEMVKTLKFY